MVRTVVVTGSTRGIGFGLARAFAAAGCRVIINGRSQGAVDAAVAALQRAGHREVGGVAADISTVAGAACIWDQAATRFGRVDIWINNAGLITRRRRFHELPFDEILSVVDANLVGTMACCHVAIERMTLQGGGQIYNFEGFGSDGMIRPGFAAYGTTKRALRHFTRSLEREYAGGAIQVGTISPGIVATDMLETETRELSAPERQRARRIYNILGDRVETVAPWIAAQVLANRKHAARIAWLTPAKALGRFVTARIRPRQIFAEVNA